MIDSSRDSLSLNPQKRRAHEESHRNNKGQKGARE